MKPTLALRSFLLGSSLLAASPLLHAAPYYWNTANGAWTDTTKWSDDATSGGTTGIVPGSGDTAVFNQSTVNGAEVITLNGPTAIGGITFNNTGTTAIRRDAATSRVLTIGASGITIASGAGQSEIGSGGVNVSVALAASQEWLNQSNNNFFVQDGGDLGAHTLTLSTTAAGGIIFTRTVTGTGSIIVSADSNASMPGGNNSYSGTTTINSGGSLTINALTDFNVNGGLGNKAANDASNLVIDGGTLRVQVSATDSNRLFTMGAGGATFEAFNTGGNSGQIKLTNTAAITYTGVGNRSLTLGGVSDDVGGSSFALDIDDVGGGNGTVGLVKNGTHAWTVSGATNSYTGGTTVSAGTLTMGSASALGSTSGQLTVDAGTLNMAGNNLTVGNLTGTGGTISGTSGTRTLTIGEGDNGGGNFQGVIADGSGGTTALTKTGTAAITLSGTNTYTGATTVSAGTLYVTGALSNSATTVQANGTIGSTGSLGNGLTIDAGGNLDLTGATLGLSSTNILSLTGGSLTLGNLAFLDIVGWDWENAALGTYELIDGAFSVDFGSTAYLNEATAYDFGNGNGGYFTSGSLNAVIFAIPEPSSALLGAIGLLALLRRKR